MIIATIKPHTLTLSFPRQFIDLCILLGCDYCDSIRGIGPKRAIELIQKSRSIDGLLNTLDNKKYTAPVNWPYAEARRLFREPEVTPAVDVDVRSSPLEGF